METREVYKVEVKAGPPLLPLMDRLDELLGELNAELNQLVHLPRDAGKGVTPENPETMAECPPESAVVAQLRSKLLLLIFLAELGVLRVQILRDALR